jgi:hypothetical protein
LSVDKKGEELVEKTVCLKVNYVVVKMVVMRELWRVAKLDRLMVALMEILTATLKEMMMVDLKDYQTVA